jgi:hypothetical protein
MVVSHNPESRHSHTDTIEVATVSLGARVASTNDRDLLGVGEDIAAVTGEVLLVDSVEEFAPDGTTPRVPILVIIVTAADVGP